MEVETISETLAVVKAQPPFDALGDTVAEVEADTVIDIVPEVNAMVWLSR